MYNKLKGLLQGKLIPKFITLDSLTFCVHQSMKYIVYVKSVT